MSDFAELQKRLKKLQEELRKDHELFVEKNDERLKQIEERGEAMGETIGQVEAINSAITELREEMGKIEVRLNRPKLDTSEEQYSPEETEAREAFFEWCRRGSDRMNVERRNALHPGSDGDGGFLSPASFESEIIMKAYDMAEIRPLAQVGTTGRDMVMLGALAKPLVAWGRVNLKVDEQKLNAGVQRIQIFDLKALVLIHNNTLDDSEADIPAELNDAFSMAVAEAEDYAFAAGAGDDSPQGIIADPYVQMNKVYSGIDGGITDKPTGNINGVDALIDVFYTPKKTYRRNGTWGFNSSTEAQIRKLKDDQGQYLWQPPVQAGAPALLLGKPVINPEGMPDIATGALPIFFGDIRAGYKVRDRAGITIRRLTERYAEYDQTGFMLKKRVGGKVVLGEAFAVMETSVQP